MASSSETVHFERRDQERAHEYVAEQIRRQITLHLITPGDALPPERDLARMFGVGRKTIQDAMRMLVGDGLIESRRGRKGGNFVLPRESAKASADQLIGRIRTQRRLVEETLTYRLEIEPAAAARTAIVRTATDLRSIAEAAERATHAATDDQFIEHDTDFHLAIARATNNRFFASAVEQTRLLLNDVLVALPESPVWRERTAGEHEALICAIETGDAESARKRMRTHVEHTDQSVRVLLAAI